MAARAPSSTFPRCLRAWARCQTDISRIWARRGAAAPNFFREGMENDTKTVSMGPPPSRGWAGDVSNMMLTKSIGSAGRSAGRSGAASGSGGAAGYFNNNELSELFSIVRGKSALRR